jgi:MATE family multidrug resistance protein
VNGLQAAPLVCSFGLLAGISVTAARARGAGDLDRAGEIVRHGMIMALVAGLALGLGATLAAPYLTRMGQPPEVVAMGRNYWLIMAWSMLPMLLFQVMRSYSEALEGPIVPMLIMFGGVALNAGLNWILIFGHWGFPRLGLTGASLATLTARIAMLVVLAVHLERDPRFSAALPKQWWGGFHFAEFRPLLAFGLPVALQLLFEVGAFAGATLMIGLLGSVSLAAHQVAITCNAVAFMLPLGLSMAVAIRIGAAVGAGEQLKVRAIGASALVLTALVMSLIGLVYLFVGRDLVHLFLHDDHALDIARSLLLVAAVFQITDGFQVVVSGALRGMADVKWPTVLTFIAYWVIALPLSWVFGHYLKFGAVGVWAGLAVGLSLAGVVLTWRFVRMTRRTC